MEQEQMIVELPKRKKAGKVWLLVVSGITIILMVAVLLCLSRFSLVITMDGSPEVTVEYGQTYRDSGAEAKLEGFVFGKSGYPLNIRTENRVQAQTLGTYTVQYSCKWLWLEKRVERNVTVVDTQKPVIKLISDPNAYTLPGNSYVEEGFSATDNYDGDLTDSVERWEEKGYVFYRVADCSGNQNTVVREIVYNDPIPPELTLMGDKELVMTAGQAYQEPGFQALDNCDGDITDRVEITGSVNSYRSGTYQLNYRVTDSYGNEATASRIVKILPLRQPDVVVPDGKVIYLTFDDGPGRDTDRLLDVLARFHVKATFFMVDTGNYETMRRVAAEGHSIGIHSASHQYNRIYASEQAFFRDLTSMRDLIREQTGVDTTLMRFPGGSSNLVSSFNPGIMSRLTQAVTDNGYQYFDWNVDSNDAGGASSADEVYRNVVAGCSGKNVSVVLQHDIRGFSVDAVEMILNWGISNGYTFLPLDPSSPGCHHGVNN